MVLCILKFKSIVLIIFLSSSANTRNSRLFVHAIFNNILMFWLSCKIIRSQEKLMSEFVRNGFIICSFRKTYQEFNNHAYIKCMGEYGNTNQYIYSTVYNIKYMHKLSQQKLHTKRDIFRNGYEIASH